MTADAKGYQQIRSVASVAMMNYQRLVSLDNGRVTFRSKNYARASEPATMTLKAEEFMQRFPLHVLPQRFG